MLSLPAFNDDGDLPIGIHQATLREAIDRFGTGSPHRMLIALRLEHIGNLAMATGQVARFVVFGSFITKKDDPNDVDVFLLMENSFDSSSLTGEAAILFDHSAAQAQFGASVFWLRKLAAFGGEDQTVSDWQYKRDGNRRGIVEIIQEKP